MPVSDIETIVAFEFPLGSSQQFVIDKAVDVDLIFGSQGAGCEDCGPDQSQMVRLRMKDEVFYLSFTVAMGFINFYFDANDRLVRSKVVTGAIGP